MIRVDHKNPCPICQHGKYCAFSEDGNFVACKRVKEGSITNLGAFGYLHKIEHIDLTGYAKNECRTRPDWKSLQWSYKIALSTYGHYPIIDGVTDRNTQEEFFIGWNGKGWTWPCWNEKLAITGMQVRYPDNSKCSVKGTEIGVFVPKTIMAHNGIIAITEGLSDAMVSMELGFKTLGKWNSDTPHDTLIMLVMEKIKPSNGIILFADNDEPGQKGAKDLKQLFKTYAPGMHTKIITPPTPYKDLRAWRSEGKLDSTQLFSILRINGPKKLTVIYKG